MNARLLLLTVLLPVLTHAQFLSAGASLQQAYIQAHQQDKKLLFLMIESASCQQCNDVANKALENTTLQQVLKNDFVALRITPDHPDLEYIEEKYQHNEGNIVLFLDKWGTLVHRMNMSTTMHATYIKEARKAIALKEEADKIRSLEKDALSGKMSIDKLYELMQARKSLSLPIDELLDQYVSQLPADSLTSITTLLRIAGMSPILGSNADKLLRKDVKLFHRVWYTIPQQERVNINNQIIFKSRELAVAEKNTTKAIEVASFAKSVHSNKVNGERVYLYNMMEYYRDSRDTMAYLASAMEYYDKYYMTISAAEIKMKDTLRMNEITRQQFPRRDSVIRTSNNKPIETIRSVQTVARFSPNAPRYGQTLNHGARAFYLMTNDEVYLKKALQWAAYANEFEESPYLLDTWARLLYKVEKNTPLAVQLEEKAIAILKTRGFPSAMHDSVLGKMKKGLTVD